MNGTVVSWPLKDPCEEEEKQQYAIGVFVTGD
jgi:hypothetical protein